VSRRIGARLAKWKKAVGRGIMRPAALFIRIRTISEY